MFNVGIWTPAKFQLIESKLYSFKVIGNGRQLLSYGHENIYYTDRTETKFNYRFLFYIRFQTHKHTAQHTCVHKHQKRVKYLYILEQKTGQTIIGRRR